MRLSSFFSWSQPWAVEYSGYLLAMTLFAGSGWTLARAGQQLAERGEDPMPRIVLVSVDPERDTPEIMNRYVSSFGDDILGITGSLEEISKLTDALGIYFAKTPVENGSYSVDHSTVVMVINPQGRFQALFSAPHRVEDLVHDLPLVMVRQ